MLCGCYCSRLSIIQSDLGKEAEMSSKIVCSDLRLIYVRSLLSL